jgi:hypothetical protein
MTEIEQWVAAVVAHLEPLPEHRAWRTRRWIPDSARRHAVTLERDQQLQEPSPDPAELVAHLTPKQQLDAARAAWRHLAALGLASPDPENDVVTRTLLEAVA